MGFLERKQCRLKLLGLKFVFHILRTSEFLARSLFNFKRTDSLQFITVWFGEKRNNVIFSCACLVMTKFTEKIVCISQFLSCCKSR